MRPSTIIVLVVLLLLSGCGTMRGQGPMIALAATAGLVGLTIGALGEQRYQPIYGGYDRVSQWESFHNYDRGYRRGRNHRR
jgi:predicted small secreted protein